LTALTFTVVIVGIEICDVKKRLEVQNKIKPGYFKDNDPKRVRKVLLVLV